MSIPKPHFIRRLYDWTVAWAARPSALIALFIIAFAESSFFPIPPDVLLIVMCVGAYQNWFKYALVCSIGSVLGGMAGYGIGFAMKDTLGWWMLVWIGKIVGQTPELIQQTAQQYFDLYGTWAVAIAGFTPIPYKVFTITAGWFQMNFGEFVVASALSRSARFFLVAGIIGFTYKKFGDRITVFIDKYFNHLTVAFTVLLIGGFLVLKLIK
ncbi:DedA family protein [bacterium]|nr:DedA family protein [bacterium]